MIQDLEKNFKKVFAVDKNLSFYFSPGRVNLIGEHTDYNGGNVFPCSLNFGTYGAIRKREDNIFRMYSENFSDLGIIEFTLDNLDFKKEHNWANYLKGVIVKFIEKGFKIDSGLDIYINGNMPTGASLSSSASVEMLMAEILKDKYSLDIDRIEMIKLCQKAENEYIGVKSGILDQFAIGMGKKDFAIFLDCNTLKYEYVPLKLDNETIIISNTNKQRGLVDSKYNDRRQTCEDAVKTLNKNGINIKYLGDLTVAEFEKCKHFLVNEEELKRARHAVTENERTKIAVEKLVAGDIEAFGKLMNESHISLRDDYEVTVFELDALVNASWDAKGVIGSRMTGGGFGGCTVSIVKNENVDDFIDYVGKRYKEETGLNADFYIVTIGDGTKKIGGC